jgi:hypothetical protein
MPYKVWAVNEILTAADMNTYVGNQTILSFAGTAARAAAIATPVEGMLSYVGSGVVEVYAGTATGWAEISGGGGVTVGTAAPSTPDEGDLWLNSTEAKMYVYYDDGTSAQWVAAVGGTVPSQGKILQVVSTTKTDTFSTSSTSYTDVTGLSVSITPSSASSKIMVFATVNSGRLGGLPTFQLVRVSTAIGVGDAAGSRTRASMSNHPGADSTGLQLTTVAVEFLDSPSTTSATTYKIQARTESSTLYVNRSGTDTDSATYPRVVSSITVMEVAG